MKDPSTRSTPGFWIGFAAGWSVYFGVTVSFELLQGSKTLATTLATGLVLTGPPALTSAVVALNRHRLLRPEWSVVRTVAVHAVVAVAFAITTALVLVPLALTTGLAAAEMTEADPVMLVAGYTLNAGFLYAIFLGFLMWSESIRRVQESQRLAAREAVLRAEAEAKSIRAQFNPHFVFNTLHSLMLLVRADPGAAERAIEDVATLIRYASVLQRRDIDAVPLAKELEVARRYVALETLRLDDRLGVTWDVDIDPDSVTVPAFALQTLVENAIKHGLEPRPEGGRLTVEAWTEGETLMISVTDDGVGAEPDEVLGTPGHGLELLRGRLTSRYGNSGALEYRTAPGEGFSATLALPVERPDLRGALDVIAERPRAELQTRAGIPK